LDSVSFSMPGSGYHIDLLDGKVVRAEDNYHIQNFKFIRGASDLTVNGEISKLIYLLFREDAELNAPA